MPCKLICHKLPEQFYHKMHSLADADLLLVMGTSLTVYPFAALCQLVPQVCPRVLINFDEVGDLGERKQDILLLDDCDKTVRALCKALGWSDELKEIWEAAKKPVDQIPVTLDGVPGYRTPPDLENSVKGLTERIGEALDLTSGVGNARDSEKQLEEEKSAVAKVGEMVGTQKKEHDKISYKESGETAETMVSSDKTVSTNAMKTVII